MNEPSPPPPLLPPSIRTRLSRIALALVALLIAWMAMAIILPRSMATHDGYPPPAPPPPLTLGAAPPPPPPPPAHAAAQAHLQALEDRVARLEIVPLPSESAAAAGEQRLAQLEARVEEMEQRLQKNSDALTAVTLFHQIKEAVSRGEAFRDAWNRLQALAEHWPEAEKPLALLAPYADTGVSTLEALRKTFETAASNAIAADKTPGAITGVMQSLIRIRKVGESQTGSDNESIIARAEAKLGRGEVEAALRELNALSPSASGHLAAWVEQARIHADARKNLDALELALLQNTAAAP